MKISEKLDKRVLECISEEVKEIWKYMRQSLSIPFRVRDGRVVDIVQCVYKDWQISDYDNTTLVLYFRQKHKWEWSFIIYIPLIEILTHDWKKSVNKDNIFAY